MKTPWLHPQAVAFIEYLKRYTGDRGALAHLRGALSAARRPNAWPLLGGFSGAIGHPAFETVAGLWAADPEPHGSAGNLGTALAKLKAENSSFEGRFKRLLTCDETEIVERVVPIVRAAQAKGIAINYVRLLSDLLAWKNDKARVEWAQAFWGPDGESEMVQP